MFLLELDLTPLLTGLQSMLAVLYGLLDLLPESVRTLSPLHILIVSVVFLFLSQFALVVFRWVLGLAITLSAAILVLEAMTKAAGAA